MKTIGVLGGIGPQATMDFEQQVHRAAQKMIPQVANGGYPPMLVYFYRHPPVLIGEDNKPLIPIQPDPRLLAAAKMVGNLVDFLVITSNGPHTMRKEIETAAGCQLLSIIDVTLAEVERRGWKRVGVLGMGRPVVYLEPLGRMGLDSVTINAERQSELDRVILGLMAGQEGEGPTEITRKAVADLRAEGVDGIILGCTELPLLLGKYADEEDLINPGKLLAEAAVRLAIE